MLPYPEIDPVAFSIGPASVHWYGLAYLTGLAFAWWLAIRRSARADSPVRREQVDDLIFYGALGVVFGGRFGYAIFYGGQQLAEDPSWILRVWQGGMSFHGGLLGVLLAMFIYARRQQIPFGALMDFVAPLVPVGLGLGRLGNFIGQELWGRATDVPWAMVFPKDPLALARHPSQLYQFALEGILLFGLLYWFSSKPRPMWAVSGMFSLGYGCLRFVAEFFREPDAHLGFQAFGWLTRGQLLCVPMIALGLYLLWYAYRQATYSPSSKDAKS
ncbi:prolipoprotein diacylglyceryl transferase [Parahaliea sp. F7430]|uniref:Phosphatidylglycerol--prolipoprotein diacylglyceryl transferase n=1 Tax=Sediminihaliea albiluteola TaxID=2758564 RepID=A0A7W2TX10_9GAMM|nr:prolipoprotein diacylglyceryl transferase [Sediminihaliea albiluteola]MBA6413520.1 prolipoprotein diacylglyceryl transferase [Sediminihaliea albiluteola]